MSVMMMIITGIPLPHRKRSFYLSLLYLAILPMSAKTALVGPFCDADVNWGTLNYNGNDRVLPICWFKGVGRNTHWRIADLFFFLPLLQKQ